MLDRIDLSIGQGETVALIGPSGGGKSTLLRCLNGLTTFEQGEIHVGDHVLAAGASTRGNGGSVQQMRRLFGMVFQDFQLFPHLTALGNVVEAPIRVLGLSRAKAYDRGRGLLERVGLGDHCAAFPQLGCPGGQKQARVAIARALAMEPRGLLCDEITSALDPELKNEVLSVLEDLRREGMTIPDGDPRDRLRPARRRPRRRARGGKVDRRWPAGPGVIDNPRHERVQTFLRARARIIEQRCR